MQTVDGEDLLLSFLFWQQTRGVSYDLVCSQVKNGNKNVNFGITGGMRTRVATSNVITRPMVHQVFLRSAFGVFTSLWATYIFEIYVFHFLTWQGRWAETLWTVEVQLSSIACILSKARLTSISTSTTPLNQTLATLCWKYWLNVQSDDILLGNKRYFWARTMNGMPDATGLFANQHFPQPHQCWFFENDIQFKGLASYC